MHRRKILDVSSFAAFNKHAIIFTNHMLGVNNNQITFVDSALIVFPFKTG
jgi:hypothetical protein